MKISKQCDFIFQHKWSIRQYVWRFFASESEPDIAVIIVVIIVIVSPAVSLNDGAVIAVVDDVVDFFHFFEKFRKISLKFSTNDQNFEDFKNLIFAINAHADPKNYAVTLNRTKKSKLEIKRKIWFVCDCDWKIRKFKKQNRRHIFNRFNECSLFLIPQRNNFIDIWFLKMIDEIHNHVASLIDVHSAFRKIAMTNKIKNEMFRILRIQISFVCILSNFRVFDSMTEVDFIDSSNFQMINFMFKFRNIYNLKTQLRREVLNSLIFIQALMRKFDQKNWFYVFEKNDLNQIIHFFFVKDIQQSLLKKNHEILIMNCIYKINKYRMFLFIISNQTAMTIYFYVVFCFIVKETNSDYCWIFIQLKILYMRLKFSNPTVFVIDMKKTLIFSIKMIFFNVNHLLYLWHINNNMLVNCKKAFDIKKKWNAFFIEWKAMIYFASKKKFWKTWNQFFQRYQFNASHANCVEYLLSIYIINYR